MRKNILILCHSYGMQFLESCKQYSQVFNPEIYEVTVAYLTGKPDDQIRAKTQTEHVLFLDCPKWTISGLKLPAILKLLKLCRQKKFSTVICHRYKPTYIMLWVAQLCRINHIFFIMHAMGTVDAWPRKLLMAALFRKNMYFAGVSNAVCNDLRQQTKGIPKENIITLYNIIDYEFFQPQLLSREQARRQLGISLDAIVFGNIGRLVKDKNQLSLLEALQLIKPQCPNAQVTIIGDGKMETVLKNFVQKTSLGNSVNFTGFILDGFRFMKAFDALVLCSVEEAFGRVLLEAMIAHVPIIATRTHGIPEVVGDAGYLIEPGNSQQLAHAMEKIYSSTQEQLSVLSDKSYQRMLDNFSPVAFKKTFFQFCPEDNLPG